MLSLIRIFDAFEAPFLSVLSYAGETTLNILIFLQRTFHPLSNQLCLFNSYLFSLLYSKSRVASVLRYKLMNRTLASYNFCESHFCQDIPQ
jgi:hypothetical protein